VPRKQLSLRVIVLDLILLNYSDTIVQVNVDPTVVVGGHLLLKLFCLSWLVKSLVWQVWVSSGCWSLSKSFFSIRLRVQAFIITNGGRWGRQQFRFINGSFFICDADLQKACILSNPGAERNSAILEPADKGIERLKRLSALAAHVPLPLCWVCAQCCGDNNLYGDAG
jgi:hypothetical protein